jgi:methylenetetrahydrofolate reductase (NADPH)
LHDFLQTASIEISARGAGNAEGLQQWFAPGTAVFINFLPGQLFRRTIETAITLRRAGFEPVPHLAARNFAGETELDEALAPLAGEAGVTKALVIGGDLSVPRGRFASALGLIDTGRLHRRGIVTVGIAGYPEGHSTLPPQGAQEVLQTKLAALEAAGHEAFIVTQFCFESAPILAWLRDIRNAGISVPVRIGVAGPASIRTLLTFAMRCGVGNSLRMLLNQPQSIGRLLRDASPEGLIREIASGIAAIAHVGPVGLHLFPFGGVAKTGEWRQSALS